MNEEQNRTNNLLDTTDCLEAIGVFRGWKNFFFIIIILCLLLLQACFWFVNLGLIETESQAEEVASAAPKEIKEAPDPNQPADATPQQSQPPKTTRRFEIQIKFKQVAVLVRFLNFVVIPIAILYCLTMMFCLKVSMLGRLGGINHISRAFFLSLLFAVFLLPCWQVMTGGILKGLIYAPEELLARYNQLCEAAMSGKISYYLRFVVYWVVLVLLLILSQIRSARWARATLRRLEVI